VVDVESSAAVIDDSDILQQEALKFALAFQGISPNR